MRRRDRTLFSQFVAALAHKKRNARPLSREGCRGLNQGITTCLRQSSRKKLCPRKCRLHLALAVTSCGSRLSLSTMTTANGQYARWIGHMISSCPQMALLCGQIVQPGTHHRCQQTRQRGSMLKAGALARLLYPTCLTATPRMLPSTPNPGTDQWQQAALIPIIVKGHRLQKL